MYSRRKVINCSSIRNFDHIRRAIKNRKNLTEGQKEAADKDFLLVEAALNSDQIIISIDVKARRIYRDMAKEVRDLSGVIWVDPIEEFTPLISYLRGDTAVIPAWQLDPNRGK